MAGERLTWVVRGSAALAYVLVVAACLSVFGMFGGTERPLTGPVVTVLSWSGGFVLFCTYIGLAVRAQD
ncbi:hypothetical protein [Kitasatospora sp. P5_F3]